MACSLFCPFPPTIHHTPPTSRPFCRFAPSPVFAGGLTWSVTRMQKEGKDNPTLALTCQPGSSHSRYWQASCPAHPFSSSALLLHSFPLSAYQSVSADAEARTGQPAPFASSTPFSVALVVVHSAEDPQKIPMTLCPTHIAREGSVDILLRGGIPSSSWQGL